MERIVLLTGAAGFLGRHLNKKLTDKGFCVKACSHSDLDITDSDSVRSVVTTIKPDYIVHCAAISSTSYAKEHPDESYAVNVRGSVNLSQVCHSNGIPLFLMSSDQVYGGCKLHGLLAEVPDSEQPLLPNNTYGEHKLMMESKVLETMPDAVLLRLSWMYENFNPEQPHIDMVSNILRAIKEGNTIKCSTREYRAVTDVDDVCDNIILSFDTLPGGVYNFGSRNTRTTFETMTRIAAATGIPEKTFIPDDSWGRNLSMDCSKAERYGIRFPDTETGLVKVLEQNFRPIPE